MIETTAVSRPRPPDMIPGYRLEKLVGQGGMGEVHRATQLSLGRTVAVKLLASELAKDSNFVVRFEKEAAALATLSHPNVVSIVDKGKAGVTYYLVMEFVDGASLRELMRSPHLEPALALRIMVDICRAIDYAHGRGVIHRDLKPENILFDEQAGRIPKVSDFGLAGFVDINSPTRFNVTETHVAMGTLSYMAPEQRVDAKTADHRADIYSLGVILYELLVGEVPMGNFDPPSQRRNGIDRRLDAVVARCLKPIPEDRYPTVRALLDDLEPLAPQSFSQVPRHVSALDRAKLKLRRALTSAARVAAAVLVVAAAIVLTVAGIRANGRERRVQNDEALTAILEKSGALAAAGRLTTTAEGRLAALGEGPDAVPLVLLGRRAALDGQKLRFALDDPDQPIGRAEIDLSELDGYQTQVVAEVTAQPPSQGFFARTGRVITGNLPHPRAALVLEGLPGRYVALVSSGTGEPLRLEWALMERRGVMLGPDSPADGVAVLDVKIDAQGELLAFTGTGKDRRQVGEPIALGASWRRHFGKMPRPALVCLEGACDFDRINFDVRREPPRVEPPPAPVVKTVSAVRPAVKRTAPKPAVRKTTSTRKRR